MRTIVLCCRPQGIFVLQIVFLILIKMTEQVKKQPVILPAKEVIKKKYIKPDFEVYELNWEAPLLSASFGANRNDYQGTSQEWQ